MTKYVTSLGVLKSATTSEISRMNLVLVANAVEFPVVFKT